ncbi:MAG: TIGR04282 family arsenosugar biosynthesis glycosyltransferase [Pseudomonadota bacterium]
MSLSNFSQELLILFTRFPQPGMAKTRLIPVLGEHGAADLQRRMAAFMFERAQKIRTTKDVAVEVHYCGGDEGEVRSWVPTAFQLKVQCKGDLGKRLHHATNTAFAEGRGKIVVIGSDCPSLTEEILEDAFQKLNHADVVIGPAHDGGYYLIGLRKSSDCLWKNISWGTEKVLRQTIGQAEAYGLSFLFLPPLADIDRPEDLTELVNSANCSALVSDG